MIYNYSPITEELCPEEINLTDKKTGKVISFQKNIVHVGRSVGCDIDFDKEYRYVARMQATFFCENGKWYLQDNCSTNGTYVNGKRLDSGERYLLEPGDEIDFAHSAVFIYEQTIEKREMPQEEPLTVIKEALDPLVLKTESPEELKNKLLKKSPELKNILKDEINGNSNKLHGNSNSELKEPKDAWSDFIGKVIDGKYEILAKCDSFQNIATFLALDTRLKKQWKIKVCNLKGDSNAVIGQALMKEINMLKQLDHPGIPRIVNVIQDEEYLYVVCDYLEGRLLEDIVQQDGPQSPEHVIDWAKQVCEILSYLHNRKPALIHRDVKPRNLLLGPEGNVMLIEFGIMREYDPKKMADTCCMGTKGYAAPEQFGTMGQTDARTDIYALGVTMYYLLTGKNPCDPSFSIVPIRQLNPTIPGGLEFIIEKCTKKNPLERYQNCEELLCALDNRYTPVKKPGLFGKIFGKK